MKLIDNVVNAYWRVRKWLSEVNWRGMARGFVRMVGNVMHKLLFEWLLPKRYRGIKKKEIFEIIFKSDTPAGKKFDVWLLVLIVANILLLLIDSLVGTTSTMTAERSADRSCMMRRASPMLFTTARRNMLESNSRKELALGVWSSMAKTDRRSDALFKISMLSTCDYYFSMIIFINYFRIIIFISMYFSCKFNKFI